MEKDILVQSLVEAVKFPLPRDINETLAKIKSILEDTLVGDSELFRSLLQDESKMAPPSCGHTFNKNELIFSCSDCAADPTCVLCAKCFQKSDHKGHKYAYYQSAGAGGCCDCGEEESWKKTLSCPDHALILEDASNNLTGEQRAFIARVDEFMKLLIPRMAIMLFKCRYVWESLTGDNDGDIALVLYNDEAHSFPEVIGLVDQVTGKGSDYGKYIADLVDNQVHPRKEIF
jgi:E3 ubiquitin-protein ligase UBR1